MLQIEPNLNFILTGIFTLSELTFKLILRSNLDGYDDQAGVEMGQCSPGEHSAVQLMQMTEWSYSYGISDSLLSTATPARTRIGFRNNFYQKI